MSDNFCLTALEAAEVAGIDLAELTRVIEANSDVAVEVAGNLRVDADALFRAIGAPVFAQAA